MFKEKYIGDKEFYKTTLSLALPMMFQGLLVTVAVLVDNMMVAGLGDRFLSGVAAANRFFMIYTYGVTGVSVAAGIFIGQYMGANNKLKMKESFRSSLILTYLMSLPFFFLILVIPHVVLSFFTTDALVIQSGLDYYSALVWTMPFLTLSIAIGGSIRAVGDTKSPIYASVIGIAVNVFFNYALIGGNFGFTALGVYGAAVSTLISRIVEAIILLVILVAKKFDFNTRLKDLFKIDQKLFKLITKNAINTGMNDILWASSMAVLMKFYATRGPAALSAYSISGTVSDIFFVLFNGMSAATTIMVGHRLGANDLEEAKGNGYKILFLGVMMSLFFGVLLILTSGFVPLVYKDISQEGQVVAIQLLRVVGLLFWVFMYNIQILFILRAGGDSFSAFVMDSGFMWLINIPVVGLFTYYTDFSIVTLYIIGQMTDVVKLLVSTAVLKKEKWVKNVTEFS